MKPFGRLAFFRKFIFFKARLSAALFFVLFSASLRATENSDIKERLNRIFYWQIAVELNLSPKAEKELVVVVEDIQMRRDRAFVDRQSALNELKAMEKSLSGKTVEPILKKYQGALTQLSKLDSEEHERLKTLLGVESLAKFYLVRESVALKIREALRSPEPKTSSK
jgi:hypothetical protein